jgi:ADP-heptose:LPS heptosyltransferase
MPNAPLEKGIRLENWLPEFQINWNIMNDFKIDPNDIAKADSLRQAGEYVIFYLGPELGNTGAGHNRGSIWKPEDWIKLGDRIKQELKVKIVVVGAEYDRSYFDKYLKGRVDWTNLIGLTSVSHLFAVVKNSRLTISYQSGVGIMSSYLGIPTGIFWRARGDSVSSDYYISFDEGMASAWVNPDMLNQKKHLPLIYGRHDSEYIMQEIKERKW